MVKKAKEQIRTTMDAVMLPRLPATPIAIAPGTEHGGAASGQYGKSNVEKEAGPAHAGPY
eukprot:10418482-Karenia_brevis.AAC.1